MQHVREEERIHVARKVHDELGQALTGLKLQLAWLSGRLPKRMKALHDKARAMANGLRGMRERAGLLGGEVLVQGLPGKGTTVTVRIPHQRRIAPNGRGGAQEYENPPDRGSASPRPVCHPAT